MDDIDPILLVQSTIREFEDLKRKLMLQAPPKEIDNIIAELEVRGHLFADKGISGARRFKWKLHALKKLVHRYESDLFVIPKLKRLLSELITKRLNAMERRLIKARDRALHEELRHKIVHMRI